MHTRKFLKTLKIDLAYDLTIPHLRVNPEELKNRFPQTNLYTHIRSNAIYSLRHESNPPASQQINREMNHGLHVGWSIM